MEAVRKVAERYDVNVTSDVFNLFESIDRSVCVSQIFHGGSGTDPCKVEAVPASSGPQCRARQEEETATALSTGILPSVAASFLSKHRLVMSAWNLQFVYSDTCRPPTNEAPCLIKRCHFTDLSALPQPLHAFAVIETRTSHHMTVHFQEHASNKRITWDGTRLRYLSQSC